MKIFINSFYLCAVALSFAMSPGAMALPSGLTLEGTLLRPNNAPVVGSAVSFIIQIRSPDTNNCLLYEETRTVDMSAGAGAFAFTVNDGTGVRTDSSGLSIQKIFSDAVQLTGLTCTTSTSYTPMSTDGRNLVVQFKDPSIAMSVFEPMPTQSINYAPISMVAQQVGDFTSGNLLRATQADGLTPVLAPALVPSMLTELTVLIGGTSAQYAKVNALNGALIPSYAGAPSGPMNGSIWYDLTGNMLKAQINGVAVPLGGGGTGTVMSIATGAGLTGGPITSTGTLSLAAVGSGGTGSKVNYDIYGRVTTTSALVETDLPTLTTPGKVLGSAITSGTIGGATAITTTGVIATTGNVGIGTTTPTAKLNLAASSGASGTAPLKLTTGTLMATAEDGALEYAASNLYYTIGTTRYVIPMNTAAGNYSNVSTISNSGGSITLSPMAGNSVIVSSATVSTSPTTGALIVNGGAGIAGAVNASGNIMSGGSVTATTNMVSPQIYGSSAASGNIKIDGTSNATVGNVLLASAGGNVGVGTTAPTSPLTVNTNAVIQTAGQVFGAEHNLVISPSSSSLANYVGSVSSASVTSGNSNVMNISMAASQNIASYAGANAMTSNPMIGVGAQAKNTGSGTVGSAYGFYSVLNNAASGTISNGYGLYVDYFGTGVTSRYGIYVVDATAVNYFAGNLGIGTATPGSKLDVKGAIRMSGSTSGYAGFQPAAAAGGTIWTLPISDGTGGQVLSTSGSGVLSWAPGTQWTTNGATISYSAGNVGIGTTLPSYQLQLSTDSAAKPGTSSWTIASDVRLKDIRAPFDRSLEALDGLHTIYFNYKKNNPLGLPSNTEYVGIKAQDALKVIPEAVSKDEKGYFHVTNDAIIWTAVNAIKELYHKWVADSSAIHREIASIKAGSDTKIEKSDFIVVTAKLESENHSLRQENSDMKKRLDNIEQLLKVK